MKRKANVTKRFTAQAITQTTVQKAAGRSERPKAFGDSTGETARQGRLALLGLLLLALTACGTPAPQTPPPTVPAVPTVVSFAATPAAATVGDTVRLSYNSTGAASCTLTTGQRPAPLTTCDRGEVTEQYAEAGSYVAEFVVRGAGQEVRRSQTITVTDAAPTPNPIPNPTPGRVTLFSGDGLGAWALKRGGAANWRTEADFFEVTPGGSVGDHDLRTEASFGDFRLHVEFWTPRTPPGTAEQARGNSGVYLQGRYEVQILDSFGGTLSGQNDAGAVYEVADAAVNASLPAETWQMYEITFRAARFSGGQKLEPARVSVSWNGQLVQDELKILGPTRLGSPESGDGVLTGPIVLQDHGDRVRFRNVWLEPLSAPRAASMTARKTRKRTRL